jgi:hydrogenase maturation protease
MTENRRIVVLGLGSLIRSDDGVGVHAVRLLMEGPRVPEGVAVVEGGTLGLALLPAIEDATHVLALDAVNTGAAPGTVARFEMSQLRPLPGSPSVHQLGFADLMEALRWMGKVSKQMVLIGVQPSQTGWGVALSREVEAALPRLLQAALEQLEEWGLQTALSGKYEESEKPNVSSCSWKDSEHAGR